MSEEAWRDQLTATEFAILREGATEPAFSSPLHAETRAGRYRCAGCDQPVYASSAKFASDTGWPAFYEGIAGAVRRQADAGLGLLPARGGLHAVRRASGPRVQRWPAAHGRPTLHLNGAVLRFRPA